MKTNENDLTLEEIANTVIWNNKFICVNGKSVFNNTLVRRGIIRVCDLVTEQNRFITTGNWPGTGSTFSPVGIFELMTVVDAIPL